MSYQEKLARDSRRAQTSNTEAIDSLAEQRTIAVYCLSIQSADFSLVSLAALNNAVQSFLRVDPPEHGVH